MIWFQTVKLNKFSNCIVSLKKKRLVLNLASLTCADIFINKINKTQLFLSNIPIFKAGDKRFYFLKLISSI